MIFTSETYQKERPKLKKIENFVRPMQTNQVGLRVLKQKSMCVLREKKRRCPFKISMRRAEKNYIRQIFDGNKNVPVEHEDDEGIFEIGGVHDLQSEQHQKPLGPAVTHISAVGGGESARRKGCFRHTDTHEAKKAEGNFTIIRRCDEGSVSLYLLIVWIRISPRRSIYAKLISNLYLYVAA